MKYNKKTLPNGLRVITVPMPKSPSTTVFVMVETGSEYEDLRTNGLSHFLEHMCFKGTKKRPSALAISHELDSIGANYNAFTGVEYTGYYAKAYSKHFDKILDIVSDIYLNQVFNEKEIERERGVILEEINMYNDLPQRKVGDCFNNLLYGNQPAGRTILGLPENIKRFSKKDFEKYKKEHYVASSTFVVVAGNFDEKKAIKKIKEIFKDIPKTQKKRKKKVKEVQSKPRLYIQKKNSDQVHIALGVRTFKANHKDETALSVLVTILGRGMSSRLWQKVREELGAAYYISSGVGIYTDHGFLKIGSGLDKNRYKLVLREIISECVRLKNEKVSPEELQKAKDHMIGSMYLNLETSDSLAEYYADQEVTYGNIETPDEIVQKIKKVSSEDIMRVARKIFVDKSLNLAVIGPKAEEKELYKILTFSGF